MNKEKENELFEKYKMLFIDKDDINKSLMRFGFHVGDGWSNLVENLLFEIKITVDYHNRVKVTDNEKHWLTHPERKIPYPQVEQVKDKFGGLRFYIGVCPQEIFDKIQGAIEFAEFISYTICEDCGCRGERRADLPWIKTMCDKCYAIVIGDQKVYKND